MKIQFLKLATVIFVLLFQFSSPSFAEYSSSEKLSVVHTSVGDKTMFIAHNFDASNVVDVLFNGESVYESFLEEIKNGNIIFSTNYDNENFLEIQSEESGSELRKRVIIFVLKSGEKVESNPKRMGSIGLPVPVAKSWGQPSVTLTGNVSECVLRDDPWWWQSATYWKRMSGVYVSATRNTVYKDDTTNSNGEYGMYWAPGYCVGHFDVEATSSGYTVSRTANVSCWGYNSSTSVDLTFSNGISNCGDGYEEIFWNIKSSFFNIIEFLTVDLIMIIKELFLGNLFKK